MNTGTPASNPGARRNALRQGQRAPRGRGHAKLMNNGRPASPHTATGLIGSRPAVWLAMAAMLAIIIALAMFQGAPPVGAAAGDATGTPGIVDQANPGATLNTIRPEMTLLAVTSAIMDTDGVTSPGWTYQWAHVVDTTTTEISGATSATYLVTDSDIGKAFQVSVSFTDDAMNAEGPLQSSTSKVVGPIDLIVWNTTLNPDFRATKALTATAPKIAQSFLSAATAETFTLDHIELIFDSIGNTATVSGNLTVTLNKNDSGNPGDVLCTLGNPGTFSSSGAHKFHAPAASDTTSGLCPALTASNTYHVVVEMDSTYTETVSVTTYFPTPSAGGGTAHGWRTPNDGQSYTSSAWEDIEDFAMLIDVRARLTEFELAELTETEVPFGWTLTPEGVAGGEKFRLLFLTDLEKATSTDINVYNEFVQAQAAGGHADIQERTNQFRVLGSTADDDARDNTETTYTAMMPGVPIYWLNGAAVADDYADLYDGTWDNENLPRFNNGVVQNFGTNIARIWTGSKNDGTERFVGTNSVALGESSVSTGRLNVGAPETPLFAPTNNPETNTNRFYALSGVFVVEANTPATATAAITGTPRVGETLTAALSDISDTQGITGIALSYQWTRDDGMNVTDIDGATSATYVLTDADAEHEINVKITFEDDYHNLEGPFTATATEAVVPTEVLVRNIGQSPESAGEDFDNISPTKIAQAFTTGANSDGYALTSIGVHFHTIANANTAASRITATLNLDSSGLPGTALCTLTDPPSFSASGLHTFTTPTTDRCTVLEAGTT